MMEVEDRRSKIDTVIHVQALCSVEDRARTTSRQCRYRNSVPDNYTYLSVEKCDTEIDAEIDATRESEDMRCR